jgi:hypothetical protein
MMEQVFDVLLDAVSSSPYLSSEQKQELANAFLDYDIDAIMARYTATATTGTATMEQPPHLTTTTTTTIDDSSNNNDAEMSDLAGTLEMLRLLFSHSRKIMGLPDERRRQVSMALFQARTVDQVRHLVLDQLPTALSLDRDERQLVANDILDHRYYRLLLPNRLDCMEPLPRIFDNVMALSHAAAPTTTTTSLECPVCLEEFAPLVSPTGHNDSHQIVHCVGHP